MANDYAPDYPTVQAPPRALPAGTMIKALGARQAATGSATNR